MDLKRLSKFFSLVLRHKPDEHGIKLDANGWAPVDAMLRCAKRSRFPEVTLADLEQMVAENDKQRFSFSSNRTKIRANQGHSVAVELQLEEREPPEFLYHGTARKFEGAIWKAGLLKMSRQHVHLSSDEVTAVTVGARHGSPVILVVESGRMFREGFKFYLSENGVWLTHHVPKNYLRK